MAQHLRQVFLTDLGRSAGGGGQTGQANRVLAHEPFLSLQPHQE